HHEVGAHEVGREHGLRVASGLGGGRPGWQRTAAGAATCVVHEDVQRVRHAAGEPDRESVDLGGVAHVALPPPNPIRLPPPDLVRRLRKDVGTPTDEHHDVAPGDERGRTGPSYTGARTRDDNRTTSQVTHSPYLDLQGIIA